MTAASPGVVAHFMINRYYPSREAYLARLADVMKEEYDAIHQAGFLLQVDCPDLAMGRHLRFPDLSTQEFLKVAEANIEVLNHADIPADRIRLHLCWGNYEGPHHRDIAKLPDDKVIIPGVVDSTTNYIEHPRLIAQRIVKYAELVGKENVIAGSDCGFGTFARTSNTVEPEVTWAKLRAMADGAAIASEQLCG